MFTAEAARTLRNNDGANKAPIPALACDIWQLLLGLNNSTAVDVTSDSVNMAVDGTSVVWKLHWALLPICCIMVGFCYLDRSNVAYMQLQLQLPPPAGMDFSASLYGNASGLFFIGYSVFQIPSNIILVRSCPPRLPNLCLKSSTAASLLRLPAPPHCSVSARCHRTMAPSTPHRL